VKRNNSHYILILLLSIVMLDVASPIETVAQVYKIYVDPGHGGSSDPGSVGNGFPDCREADVNLSVGLKLLDVLTSPPILGLKASDYEFKFSRLSDTAIEPRPRARDANEYDATIFVSIHHNGESTLVVQRIETLFSSDTTECCDATDSIQNIGCCLNGQARKDTTSLLAKKMGYYLEQIYHPRTLLPPTDVGTTKSVLSRTYMASTITEASYITESVEANKRCPTTSQSSGTEAFNEAHAHFRGISSYLQGGGLAIVEYRWLTEDWIGPPAVQDVWVDLYCSPLVDALS